MNTRKELENDVASVNKTLKDKVHQMEIITLLRNCHPMYRLDHARALHKEGRISDRELSEFKKRN